MTDTITLPRSVVEQALEALGENGMPFHDYQVMAAFRAALAAPQPDAGIPASVPDGWKLVGWWHQVEDPDECDFFYADAINGDCPSCHPCYADIGGEE